MQVKIGRVKSVKEILGLEKETDPNLTGFVEMIEGHHYVFNEQMNAWGVLKHVCIFAERTAKDHPHYRFVGTLDGASGYNFREEWLEGAFDQEIKDDHPCVLFLKYALRKHAGPEDIIKRMMEGG